MQTVSPKFHQLAQSSMRPHKWEILMSFDKQFDDTIDYFTLDSSQLDGTDVLAPVDDNPIQYWDYYSYSSYSDRLHSLSWSSSLDFPYSIRYSSADLTLNNHDNYFTPHTNSPLAPYILPSRPIKILAGYGSETSIQQFVGITQAKPVLDKNTKLASFHALDFISEIASLRFSSTVALSNVRTDEALIAIFNQFGLSSSSYLLDHGKNTIPFLFLESDSSVGDALNKIMQAEGGELYLDEQGIIRFTERAATPPTPLFTFNSTNVSSYQHTDEDQFINHVIIKSSIRQLQDSQPIFYGSGVSGDATLTDKVLVPASSTATLDIRLDDPISDIVVPTLGANSTSWFTAQKINADNISSNITVSATSVTTTTLTLTFSNTNGFDAYVDAITVWAKPAKIVDSIIFEAKNQDSIDSEGDSTYEIDNDLLGDVSNCESLAYTILNSYSKPGSIIKMTVKGDYALQLGDVTWVDLDDINGSFKIIGNYTAISDRGVEEVLKLRRFDTQNFFTLDVSILDGVDILAP